MHMMKKAKEKVPRETLFTIDRSVSAAIPAARNL